MFAGEGSSGWKITGSLHGTAAFAAWLCKFRPASLRSVGSPTCGVEAQCPARERGTRLAPNRVHGRRRQAAQRASPGRSMAPSLVFDQEIHSMGKLQKTWTVTAAAAMFVAMGVAVAQTSSSSSSTTTTQDPNSVLSPSGTNNADSGSPGATNKSTSDMTRTTGTNGAGSGFSGNNAANTSGTSSATGSSSSTDTSSGSSNYGTSGTSSDAASPSSSKPARAARADRG